VKALLINAVQTDGKVVRTCNFHIPTQRHDLNDVLSKRMPAMGLTWDDPQSKQHRSRADVPTDNISWQDAMKNAITTTVQNHNVVDMATFQAKLADCGITITQHRSGWTYHDADGHKSRDFYQRINKQTGEIKSTRGLGRAYTADNITQILKSKQQQMQVTGKAVIVDHTAPKHMPKKKEVITDAQITDEIDAVRRDAAIKLKQSIEANQLRRTRQVQQQINERETDNDQQQVERDYRRQRASRAIPRRNQPTRQPNRQADGPGF